MSPDALSYFISRFSTLTYESIFLSQRRTPETSRSPYKLLSSASTRRTPAPWLVMDMLVHECDWTERHAIHHDQPLMAAHRRGSSSEVAEVTHDNLLAMTAPKPHRKRRELPCPAAVCLGYVGVLIFSPAFPTMQRHECGLCTSFGCLTPIVKCL